MLKEHNLCNDGNHGTKFRRWGEAVWNAVRSQQYVSHIKEMIKVPTPRIDKQQKRVRMEVKSYKNDVEENDLIDQFEKLIQIYDSYGALEG